MNKIKETVFKIKVGLKGLDKKHKVISCIVAIVIVAGLTTGGYVIATSSTNKKVDVTAKQTADNGSININETEKAKQDVKEDTKKEDVKNDKKEEKKDGEKTSTSTSKNDSKENNSSKGSTSSNTSSNPAPSKPTPQPSKPNKPAPAPQPSKPSNPAPSKPTPQPSKPNKPAPTPQPSKPQELPVLTIDRYIASEGDMGGYDKLFATFDEARAWWNEQVTTPGSPHYNPNGGGAIAKLTLPEFQGAIYGVGF